MTAEHPQRPDLTVVLDIGGVIGSNGLDFSRPDPELTGFTIDALQQAYWQNRDAYDRGEFEEQYYGAMADDLLGAGEAEPKARLADHLRDIDANQWNVTLPGSMETVAALAQQGYSLWLLSNAPRVLAEAVRNAAWSAPFSGSIFSGEVGMLKPDPRIYAIAQEQIGVPAEQLIFFDDRPANVQAAREAGWRAEVFAGDYQGLLATVNG